MKNECGNEQVAPKNMQPRYKVGELVAIAQNYREILESEYMPPRKETEVCKLVSDGHIGCTNKMYVSANLMPHHILITGIRVERLQDISDEDCMAEGVSSFEKEGNIFYYVRGLVDKDYPNTITHNGMPCTIFSDAKSAFKSLIENIEGRQAWKYNYWVVVYDFKRHD